MSTEKPQRIDPSAKIPMPHVKIFLRPVQSAILPNGTSSIEITMRYEETTQFSVKLSQPKLLCIDGRAMLMDDARNGVEKTLRFAAASIIFFSALCVI